VHFKLLLNLKISLSEDTDAVSIAVIPEWKTPHAYEIIMHCAQKEKIWKSPRFCPETSRSYSLQKETKPFFSCRCLLSFPSHLIFYLSKSQMRKGVRFRLVLYCLLAGLTLILQSSWWMVLGKWQHFCASVW
jgi:hypothetical protein